MQSWDDAQNGNAPDGRTTWSTGYVFSSQVGGHFDGSGQDWTQDYQGQTSYNPTSTSDPAFYSDTVHGNGVLDGALDGVSVGQTSFHGHGGPQQFPANSNALGDFSNMQSNVFNQPKIDLGSGFGEASQGQNHHNSLRQAQTQAFPQQMYSSFAPRNEQPFQPPTTYSPQQSVRQHAHQGGIEPALDSLQQQNYQAHQPFTQQQQHSQHQQASQAAPQTQAFDQTAASFSRQSGQQDLFSSSPNHFLQPQQQYQQPYLQPVSFSNPQTAVNTPSQPQVQAAAPTTTTPQQPQHASISPIPPPTTQPMVPQGVKRAVEQTPLSQPSPDSSDAVSSSTEPTAKKRKKVVKKAPETKPDGNGSPVPAKKTDEIDILPQPTSTEEELADVAKFKKRPPAARAKLPAIPGAGYLVADGTIKLDAQKSHDKLAPLVAIPPQSGRRILPEIGRDLACEIQGKFTAQFKPLANGGGLDDRRREAKELLEEFDKAMLELGKKRPKYSEYPHAFKEQLKADESARKMAEKRARTLEEERNQPVRPATRPADPVDGAVWDITGIVHIDAQANRTTALLAGAVQQAGEYFMTLRGDLNRAKQEVDQAVKEKRAEAELARLKRDADAKKQILARSLEAAKKVGDEAVLENLGSHVKLVINLVNLLITCIKTNDISGELPKATLGLMTSFRMTQKVATQANFETVRKRLFDKGDGEVKELLEAIKSRIKKDAEAESSPKKSVAASGASTKAKAGIRAPGEISAKRGRDGDEDADSRVIKRQALEASVAPSQPPPATAKATAGTSSVKPVAPKPRSASGILPGKSRPAAKPAVPKHDTSKLDAAKMEPVKPSAGEKPIIKPEPRKAASKTDAKPDAAKQPPKPAATATSMGGIASLLKSINKPKANVPQPEKKESDSEKEIQETPEEKKKRLRKEERRKLRVSWKADNELEQVRYFQKEAEEEDGFEGSSIKDAGDDRSEGMVLKQRSMVTDDEDDDDDIPYKPWIEPLRTDYSHFPAEYRQQIFTATGGDVVVDTEEQKRIAEREQKVLIAIYTSDAEIPPSAKSPRLQNDYMPMDSKIGHLPRDDRRFEEAYRRIKDGKQFGRDGALHYGMKRVDTRTDPAKKVNSILDTLKSASTPLAAAPSSAPNQASTGLFDPRPTAGSNVSAEERVLALLSSDAVKQWRSTEPLNPSMAKTQRRRDYPDPRVQSAADAIEKVVASLSNKPFPPQAPPDWMQHNAEAVKEWWVGYHKDAAARAKKEEESRARAAEEAAQLAAAQAQAQAQSSSSHAQSTQDAWAAYYAQQQQAYAPYMAMIQQMQQGGQAPAAAPPLGAPAGSNDQLQSILAALSQSQGQQGQAGQGQMGNYMHPNDPSYQQLMMLSQISQQRPPSNDYAPAQYNEGRDWERDRDRDRDRDREQGSGRDRDRDRNGKGRKSKGSGTLPPHQPANKALIGTKPCVFYKKGNCARGDQCTFRHE